MMKAELQYVAERYLARCPPETRNLQREINAAFVDMYSSDHRLGQVQNGPSWAFSQLGAFTAGYIRGAVRKKT